MSPNNAGIGAGDCGARAAGRRCPHQRSPRQKDNRAVAVPRARARWIDLGGRSHTTLVHGLPERSPERQHHKSADTVDPRITALRPRRYSVRVLILTERDLKRVLAIFVDHLVAQCRSTSSPGNWSSDRRLSRGNALRLSRQRRQSMVTRLRPSRRWSAAAAVRQLMKPAHRALERSSERSERLLPLRES